MTLRFDPENLATFKTQIRNIPGYPTGEELPIKDMIFEAGALWHLPDLLASAGISPAQPLSVVMDRTPMQREGRQLSERADVPARRDVGERAVLGIHRAAVAP